VDLWIPRVRWQNFDGYRFERPPLHRCGLQLFWFQRPRIGFSHERLPRILPALEIEAELQDVESNLYGLTDETTECCETETQKATTLAEKRRDSRSDLDPFLLSCG
jgi:hypothetical protein